MLYKLFKQIYYKFGKNKKNYKFKYIMKVLLENTVDLSKNGNLLLLCVIRDLVSKKGSYLDSQTVRISYNNKLYIKGVTSDKKNFFSAIKELEALEILVKVKGSLFLVNPYYIDNMTKSQWQDFRNDLNKDFIDLQIKYDLLHRQELHSQSQ